MSESSDRTLSFNIYEENLNEETTLDLSSQKLETVPKINNDILCMLNLRDNCLKTLPDDFFPSLPSLMWLDLRDNQLTDLPKSIKNHQGLTHLLLQNNCLTSLPNELGTVANLKVLLLNGNPLMYPPREVINEGIMKIIEFLNDKYINDMLTQSQIDLHEDVGTRESNDTSLEGRSYNSVLDGDKLKVKNLTIKMLEREQDSEEEYYGKIKGKCPKLDKSRHKTLPSHYQSTKYLKPFVDEDKKAKDEKIKQCYLKEKAIKKHRDLLVTREKILQDRKNREMLKNWRKDYRSRQAFTRPYKLDINTYPYDTSPEYMTLLTRQDIEKDLPDKYKRSLLRRARPSVPRKSDNDVHLAMKIKQLFENLEAIDLNRQGMTPRTEQKVLMNEIQKISEIKQKLMELSTVNGRSVPD